VDQGDTITIELGGRVGSGRRIAVPAGTTEVLVPIAGSALETVLAFRPSGRFSDDGVEVWLPHIPSPWSESSPMPLA
jgi:hypothetical protein